MMITENLHSALTQLRLVDQPRLIWIDQLCINQSDLEERSSQVLLMCDIYHGAQEVVVWLGEESDDSARALDLLVNFATAVKRLPPYTAYQSVDIEDYGLPPLNDPAWKALANLFHRSWVSRSQHSGGSSVPRLWILICPSSNVSGPCKRLSLPAKPSYYVDQILSIGLLLQT